MMLRSQVNFFFIETAWPCTEKVPTEEKLDFEPRFRSISPNSGHGVVSASEKVLAYSFIIRLLFTYSSIPESLSSRLNLQFFTPITQSSYPPPHFHERTIFYFIYIIFGSDDFPSDEENELKIKEYLVRRVYRNTVRNGSDVRLQEQLRSQILKANKWEPLLPKIGFLSHSITTYYIPDTYSHTYGDVRGGQALKRYLHTVQYTYTRYTYVKILGSTWTRENYSIYLGRDSVFKNVQWERHKNFL